VRIAFEDFTDAWSDATGDPIVKCTHDTSVCPTAETLSNMKLMQIWAEGVEGEVHLEIESISAYGCAPKQNVVLL